MRGGGPITFCIWCHQCFQCAKAKNLPCVEGKEHEEAGRVPLGDIVDAGGSAIN
jgi:hypothetical protein